MIFSNALSQDCFDLVNGDIGFGQSGDWLLK